MNLSKTSSGHDGLGCPGGGDDQVRRFEIRVEIFPSAGHGPHFIGEGLGRIESSVDDGDVSGIGGDEIAKRLFSHFATSDDENLFIVESFKELVRNFADGNAGNADASSVDFGFIGNAFGGVTGVLKEGVGPRPGREASLRELVGFLDLGLDLGFADDEAIETGSNRKKVEDCLAVLGGFHMGSKILDGDMMKLRKVVDEPLRVGEVLILGGNHVEFHAIAGIDQNDIGTFELVFKVLKCVFALGFREGKSFTQLKRSLMVTTADHAKFHGFTSAAFEVWVA